VTATAHALYYTEPTVTATAHALHSAPIDSMTMLLQFMQQPAELARQDRLAAAEAQNQDRLAAAEAQKQDRLSAAELFISKKN